MALPQSIAALAEWLGKTDVNELLITCYYCGSYLTWVDKVLYDSARLQVIWHHGAYFAYCYPCTQAAAKLEFMAHYSGVTNAAEVELQNNCSIRELEVRCLRCLREFNGHEKTDLILTRQDLFKVRDELRAVCVVCRVGTA